LTSKSWQFDVVLVLPGSAETQLWQSY